MTSILSSISGYFSKSLILGTFLPVVIFIVLAVVLLVPYLPPDIATSLPLESLDKEWKIVGVTFVAIVLSGLLYNLSIPILRLYEGYPWRSSWIGSRFTKRHRDRFDAAQLRVDAMRASIRAIDASIKKISEASKKIKDGEPTPAGQQTPNEVLVEQTTFLKDLIDNLKILGDRGAVSLSESKWLQDWRQANNKTEADEIKAQAEAIKERVNGIFSRYRVQIDHAYPSDRNLILPTRLGNVIRSFEYYSDREYGIDSIEIWPRLVAVIPKDYAVSIDDAKTTFDFMLNCSLLSLLLGVLILAAGLTYPSALSSFTPALYWIVKIVSLALLSYFFYRLSMERAHSWGLLVKSSFDLYRWDLLKQLGYSQQPKHRLDERKLWEEISRQAIYGDRFDKTFQDYAEPEPKFPSVESNSKTSKLEITRGIKPDAPNDALIVYLRIKNKDKTVVKEVTVKDCLSQELEFQWDSARVGSERVLMSGTNPYAFEIGDLQPDAEAVLTYKAISKRGRDTVVRLV